jgi:hypothetical protein
MDAHVFSSSAGRQVVHTSSLLGTILMKRVACVHPPQAIADIPSNSIAKANIRFSLAMAGDGVQRHIHQRRVCTENLKSDHSGDEVRTAWRVN